MKMMCWKKCQWGPSPQNIHQITLVENEAEKCYSTDDKIFLLTLSIILAHPSLAFDLISTVTLLIKNGLWESDHFA